MRISIHVDSAPTEQVRELACALHAVGLTATLTVGLNGPECWEATTPMMTPTQWAGVTARLVKFNGELISDVLERSTA